MNECTFLSQAGTISTIIGFPMSEKALVALTIAGEEGGRGEVEEKVMGVIRIIRIIGMISVMLSRYDEQDHQDTTIEGVTGRGPRPSALVSESPPLTCIWGFIFYIDYIDYIVLIYIVLYCFVMFYGSYFFFSFFLILLDLVRSSWQFLDSF